MTFTTKLIAGLGILLVVVAAGSLYVLTVVPPLSEPETENPSSDGFDRTLLERQVFKLLNRQAIQDQSVPVKPPTNVGKANPFL